MPRFPVYERERTIASGPTAGFASPEALSQVGRAVEGLGAGLSVLAEAERRRHAHQSASALIEFEQAERASLKEAKAKARPDGKDFTKTAMGGFVKRAEPLQSLLPEKLRPELHSMQASLAQDSAAFETTRRRDYYERSVSDAEEKLAAWMGREPNHLDRAQSLGTTLISQSGLEESRKAERLAGFQSRVQEAALGADLTRLGKSGESREAAEVLVSLPRYAAVPEDKRSAALGFYDAGQADAQRQASADEAAKAKKVQVEGDAYLNDLLARMRKGEAGAAELYAGLMSGFMTPQHAITAETELARATEAKKREADARRRVADPKATFDPNDQKDRKDVELLIPSDSAARLKKGDEEARKFEANDLAPTFGRTGIMPKSVVDSLRRRTDAKDPADAAAAAETLNRLEAANPSAFAREFGTDAATWVRFYRDGKGSDRSPEQAIQAMREPPAEAGDGRWTPSIPRAPSLGGKGVLSTAGLLSEDESEAEQKSNIQSAEARLAKARTDREAMNGLALPPLPEGTPATAALQRKRAEYDARTNQQLKAADDEIAAAEEALEKARTTKPEFTRFRNGVDNFTRSVFGVLGDVPYVVGAIGGLIPGVGDDNRMTRFGTAVQNELERLYPGDPARADDFLSATLASGLGSATSFVLFGGAARAAGYSSKAVMAALGASSQGAQGHKEAVAAGADPTARMGALFLNAGLGVTEALVFERFLDRLNVATGGRVKTIIRNTAAQSLEEAMQEVGVQIGSNVAARVFYDHQREIFAGVGDAGLAGLAVGALFGAGAGVAKTGAPQARASSGESGIASASVTPQRDASEAGGVAKMPGSQERASSSEAKFAGRSIALQHQVVEAESLIPSHRIEANGRAKPDRRFPVELRRADRASGTVKDRVESIIAAFRPERLKASRDANDGAPIVGPDGAVETGGVRALALQRLYEVGNERQAEDYRKFLQASGFKVEGVRRPVLIARRVSGLDPDERAEFVRVANDNAPAPIPNPTPDNDNRQPPVADNDNRPAPVADNDNRPAPVADNDNERASPEQSRMVAGRGGVQLALQEEQQVEPLYRYDDATSLLRKAFQAVLGGRNIIVMSAGAGGSSPPTPPGGGAAQPPPTPPGGQQPPIPPVAPTPAAPEEPDPSGFQNSVTNIDPVTSRADPATRGIPLIAKPAPNAPISGAVNDTSVEVGETLEDLADGAGFSGVYFRNVDSRKSASDPVGWFIAYPSGPTALKNGNRPQNRVDRRGGHLKAVKGCIPLLLRSSIQTNKGVGFSLFLRKDTITGELSFAVDWYSVGINDRNFGEKFAPNMYRKEIIDLIKYTLNIKVEEHYRSPQEIQNMIPPLGR